MRRCRPRNPTIKPMPPRNSAQIARKANTAGIPISRNMPMVAEKPGLRTIPTLSARHVQERPRPGPALESSAFRHLASLKSLENIQPPFIYRCVSKKRTRFGRRHLEMLHAPIVVRKKRGRFVGNDGLFDVVAGESSDRVEGFQKVMTITSTRPRPPAEASFRLRIRLVA